MKRFLVLTFILVWVFTIASCNRNVEVTQPATMTTTTTTQPPVHEHLFGEWVTIKEPTVTQEGLEERICECGEKESKMIPLLSLVYSEGLEFTLNDNGLSYSLTGIGACTDTDLVIPNIYNGLPVTNIDNFALRDCTWITSIIIPEYVESIGNYTFNWCTLLTNIGVSEYNLYYKSIDGNLFSKDGKTIIRYALGKQDTSYIISDSVTNIDRYAFYRSYALTNVVIPDSVTSMGGYAFADCVSLTNIVIPDSITSIEEYTFYYCDLLTSVEIPSSVTYIGKGAFGICPLLTNIVIPASVTSIGGYAFAFCSSLTRIFIPISVTSIGQYAFKDCTLLKIYCEVDSKPDGWYYNPGWGEYNNTWNHLSPVVWGYKPE